MALKKNKKQQILHNSNVGVGEDKISNLPDVLIHHVLSFLPIKCAMSTCILSKRWNYVSNSIPILDFRNWRTIKDTRKEKELETRCFMNFLDTILLHEKPNIQKFYFDDVDVLFDQSRVHRWIKTIMKRKVEEFGLSLNSSSLFSIFPLSFFTCDSLTVLDLALSCRLFNIANTVSFPKLKILRLTWVSFLDETSARRLFSNCPNLEELRLSRCQVSQGGLRIASLTLKHLSISSCFLSNTIVEISAPNLLNISYRGYPPEDFVLENFPSLVEADAGFYSEDEYQPDEIFVKLFKELSTAICLKICGNSFPVLSEAGILLTNLPSFNNLIHLEVNSDCGWWNSVAVRTFFRFLQVSPGLESIVFTQSINNSDYDSDDEDDGTGWSLDPKCSLPHLKSIKFNEFVGSQLELNVIKLFMKYARFLETLTIVASPELSKNHEEQLNVTKLLLVFPRSANFVVKFLTSSEDT